MTHSEMGSKYKAVLLDRCPRNAPCYLAILIIFGQYLVLLGVSHEEMEAVVMWIFTFKKWLGETFLGKPRRCELKLGWRNGIKRLCKEG